MRAILTCLLLLTIGRKTVKYNNINPSIKRRKIMVTKPVKEGMYYQTVRKQACYITKSVDKHGTTWIAVYYGGKEPTANFTEVYFPHEKFIPILDHVADKSLNFNIFMNDKPIGVVFNYYLARGVVFKALDLLTFQGDVTTIISKFDISVPGIGTIFSIKATKTRDSTAPDAKVERIWEYETVGKEYLAA